MGRECGNKRLQNRIHRNSTHKEDGIQDSSSNQQSSKRHSSRRSKGSSFKEGYLSNLPSLRGRVLVDLLSGSQEDGRLETYSEPQALKQIYQAKEVQNGESGNCSQSTHTRSLGNINRSKRCLPTHPDQSRSSKVASFPYQRSGICLPLPSFWPFYCPKSFYSGSESCKSIPPSTRSPDPFLFGRLAHHKSVSGNGSSSYRSSSEDSCQIGFHCESQKVSSPANSVSYFPGSQTGSSSRKSISFSRKNLQPDRVCKNIQSSRICSSSSLVETSRFNGEYGGAGAMVQVQNETHPAPSTLPLQTKFTSSVETSSSFSHCPSRTGLVGNGEQPFSRQSFSSSPTSARCYNGCFEEGVGRSSQDLQSERSLVSRSVSPSYQCSRAPSSVQFTQSSGASDRHIREENSNQIRQFDSCVVYKQTGRDKISYPLSSHQTSTDMVYPTGNFSLSCTHPGNRQHSSRQSVTGSVSESHRVVSSPPDSTDNFRKSGNISDNGFVCYSSQQANSSVLLKNVGRESICNRRTVHFLEQNDSVRISPNFPDLQSNSKNSGRRLRNNPGSAILATATLVSNDDGATNQSAIFDTSRPGCSTNDGESQSTVPQCGTSKIDCLDIIKQHYQASGFSGKSANLVARGRRKSTLRVYSSRLRPYFDWCNERQIDPYHASIADIADFLETRHAMGLLATTVKGYKSAILAIHRGLPNGMRLRNDPDRSLYFLIEGMNNVRPPQRKIMPEWDLSTVLKSLNQCPYEPLQSASAKDLTVKTVFLIAIASGKRCSELHALVTGNHIVFGNQGATLHFRPDFLAKNERSDFSMAPLFIPYLDQSGKDTRKKRLSCPVRALRWYLTRTETARKLSKSSQLFITSQKPFKPAAKSTIAGWMVTAIVKADAVKKGDNIPTAHSTRAISSSWAYNHGLSVNEIRNTVSWRTETTFVSRYLRDVGPCCDKAKYALSVLGASTHQH